MVHLPAPTSVCYEFPAEEATQVFPTCPDCGDHFEELPNDSPPPATPVEAWSATTCRGTRDILVWRWCMHRAALRQAQRGTTTYFDVPLRPPC